MDDGFESFQAAIKEDQDLNGDNGLGSGYMSSLVNSMSLMLEEFYSQLDVVGVSSFTGDGFDEFMQCVDKKVDEYDQYYKQEREKALNLKKKKEEMRKQKSLNGLMKDLGLNEKSSAAASDNDSIDAISDLEEDANDGLVDRDEDEGVEREYTFPGEERTKGEVNENSAPDLQRRYQEAMQQVGKTASSETAENIAKYIRN